MIGDGVGRAICWIIFGDGEGDGGGVEEGCITTCACVCVVEVPDEEPPHSTILLYAHDEPLRPSLQITFPFDC